MRRDLTRTTLAILFIGGLIIASFWIVRPFIAPVIWAAMIVVATWPLMLRAEKVFGGRRGPAVAVMTLAMLLVFVLPFWAAVAAIAEYSDQMVTWTRNLRTLVVPTPPPALEMIPLVGSKLASLWREVAATPPEVLATKVGPYAGAAVKWVAAEVGSLGLLVMQFLLTVGIAAVLYSGGEGAGREVRRFTRRLAGERGDAAALLMVQAIRGVALGVVVTALVQSLLAGLGLLVAGVPLAGVLAALMLILCIAQIGTLPVMVPAVIWLFWSGDTGWGAVLLVVAIASASLDNVLRPLLIKKGADLPLVLIFAGVIGGLLSLGLIGIFVGPVVLAVSFTLLEAWIDDGDDLVPDEPAPTEAKPEQ